jgi:RNA polymerase primary sigma factor
MRDTRRILSERLGREPDDAELGAALGLSGDEVREQSHAPGHVVSLEDPASGSGESSRGALIGDRSGVDPEECFQRAESRELVHSGLRELSSRERFVLECRYGLKDDSPMTLSEVSRRIGVSREMVRLIEARAREKMRHRIRRRRRPPAGPVRRYRAAVA